MDKQEILKRVETSLNNIRPFLQKDGGDVEVIDITSDGELQLKFLGSCSTCSMSNMTFKNGIEENIKHDVSEVKKVEVINLTQELV
ncbi:MAG: Fe-S cluster biogenesis protein NfuA [Saprospiraceae bacterium]|jgi:Fe-S cluster biogenesis protein NfuA